jgi:hypothetical protein
MEELPDRLAQHRVRQPGSDITQGGQHKSSLMKSGMGNHQPFFPEHLCPEKKQVHIQGAGSPGLGPTSPELILNGQAALEQGFGGEVRIDFKDAIQIPTLARGASDGIGFIKGRTGNHPDSRQPVESFPGSGQT